MKFILSYQQPDLCSSIVSSNERKCEMDIIESMLLCPAALQNKLNELQKWSEEKRESRKKRLREKAYKSIYNSAVYTIERTPLCLQKFAVGVNVHIQKLLK